MSSEIKTVYSIEYRVNKRKRCGINQGYDGEMDSRVRGNNRGEGGNDRAIRRIYNL